jgi:hypothetical protein
MHLLTDEELAGVGMTERRRYLRHYNAKKLLLKLLEACGMDLEVSHAINRSLLPLYIATHSSLPLHNLCTH